MEHGARKLAPASASLANLAAGVMACVLAAEGYVVAPGLFIVLAVVLDSMDGALARKLDACSQFGVQMDSLADMVSFGVAPAVLIGSLVPPEFKLQGWGLALVMPLCAAWRLARYTAGRDESDSHGVFNGLPSTAAGGAAAAAVLLVHLSLPAKMLPAAYGLLPCVLLLLGFLMVSKLPYRHIRELASDMPFSLTLAWTVGLVGAALIWGYEWVLAPVFWGYVVSGVAASVRQKMAASGRART